MTTTLGPTTQRFVSTCTRCTDLCVEITPGVFTHLDDQCRECFGTGQPCPYPEDHGVHTYAVRAVGRVACTQAEAHECHWCRRALDASQLPCPDHPQCCGCCE